MKYKIEATIPTTQYGNLRPTFELENDSEQEEALSALAKLWQRFGETPLKDKQGGGVKVTTFTGEEIIWNEETHTYTDLAGNVLLSGSAYANENSPKFDMDMLLPKTATAWGVDEEELRQVWKINSDVSNNWGSAIHKALERYHNHHRLGDVVKQTKELDQNYVLPKNTFLRGLVLDFVEKFGVSAESEVLVSDVANKMAGTIDRLETVEDKVVRIGDYKTNNEMDSKKMLKYQKQLSFYAHILNNKGWTVQGLDLFYLDQDSGWQKTELEILPLES
jgi:hypothetical protein